MKKDIRGEVYRSVFDELVRQNNELEARIKRPFLHGPWIRLENHPRHFYVEQLTPNLLKDVRN